MVLPMDDSVDEHNLERLRAADTLLLGATTFMGLKGYWPAVADNPEVSPAVAAIPDVADTHRETGVRNNEIQKIVVSDSITEDDTPPWTETTTVVRRADANQAIAELKDQPGKEILMFGSRTLWNDLLVAGLVDELYLIGATVLGEGTRAFGAGPVPAAAAARHPAPGCLGQPAAAVRGHRSRRMNRASQDEVWPEREEMPDGLGRTRPNHVHQ